MATHRTLARLDALIWILIYAGLFMLVLGIATHGEHLIAGWSFGVVGTVVALTGVVLIWVRSRLREAPAGSAESAPEQGPQP